MTVHSNFDSLIVTKLNSSSQLHQINFFLIRENNWSVSAAIKSQQIRQDFIFSLFKKSNKQKKKTQKPQMKKRKVRKSTVHC